jgi:hypothetical protein
VVGILLEKTEKRNGYRIKVRRRKRNKNKNNNNNRGKTRYWKEKGWRKSRSPN